ncbi:MAG TPA: 50S ribosomal protein L24e [Acidobacteriota bacterium]|nr:50S ribosomal protein L24e [Acidobacteriota bacterium]
MVKCSFSGKTIPPGQGIMYVQNDGRVYYFINKKAERNMLKLDRKPRTTKWTEEYHRLKRDTKKQ